MATGNGPGLPPSVTGYMTACFPVLERASHLLDVRTAVSFFTIVILWLLVGRELKPVFLALPGFRSSSSNRLLESAFSLVASIGVDKACCTVQSRLALWPSWDPSTTLCLGDDEDVISQAVTEKAVWCIACCSKRG